MSLVSPVFHTEVTVVIVWRFIAYTVFLHEPFVRTMYKVLFDKFQVFGQNTQHPLIDSIKKSIWGSFDT